MHYLALSVFAIGLGLLLFELLVLPGTAWAGITGALLILGTIVIALLYNDSSEFSQDLLLNSLWALVWVLTILAGALLLVFVGGVRFSQTRFFLQIALPNTQDAQKGYTAPQYPLTLIAQQGFAQTPLHPVGKVQVDGNCYDAKTTGNYIEQGTTIIVIAVEGSLLQVQALCLANSAPSQPS